MNRQEMMDHVVKMLNECDEYFVKKVLRDLEDHFEQGKQAGKTEAEIIESFVEMDEWIEELKCEYEKKMQRDGTCESDSGEITAVCVEAGVVQVEVVGGTDEVSWHLRDKWASMNVYDYDVNETHKNGKLMLKVVPKERTRFGTKSSHVHFVLAVPHDLEKLFIETTAADINVKNLDVEILRLSTKSGDISIKNCEANMLVKSQSGDIRADECEGDHLSFSSTSGDIDLKLEEADELSVKSTSGEIEVELEEAESVLLSSLSGDIEAEGEIKQLNITTKSGDVEVLTSCIEALMIETVSGDVEVKVECCDGMQGLVETSSGDVEIDFEELENFSGNAFEWGDGSTKVMIKTVSGDITLEE